MTRHRFHLIQQLTREKNYFLSSLFLKYSRLAQACPLCSPYLCEVIDDRTRLILSWRLGKRATTALAIATLAIAIQRYGKPVALKTDPGAQFKDQFAAYLKKEGIYHLKSIPYYPRCNAKIERVFQDVEDHVVSQITATTTLPQLLAMLAEEVYQHNYVRPHQSLGG